MAIEGEKFRTRDIGPKLIPPTAAALAAALFFPSGSVTEDQRTSSEVRILAGFHAVTGYRCIESAARRGGLGFMLNGSDGAEMILRSETDAGFCEEDFAWTLAGNVAYTNELYTHRIPGGIVERAVTMRATIMHPDGTDENRYFLVPQAPWKPSRQTGARPGNGPITLASKFT